MEKNPREIILIDQFHIQRNQSFDKSGEVYFLDPVDLFLKVDWRLFEEDATVTNIFYGVLFEPVVILHKKLVCYWHILNFPDENWVKLLSQCKESKIKTRIIYSDYSSDEE